MFPPMFGGGGYSWSSTIYSPSIVSVPGSENMEAMIAQQWLLLESEYRARVNAAHGAWTPLPLPLDTGIRQIAMTRTNQAETGLIDTQQKIVSAIVQYVYFEVPSNWIPAMNLNAYALLDTSYGAIHAPLYSLVTPKLTIDGEFLGAASNVPVPPTTAVYASSNATP